jgi:hypothetical protein
MWCKQLTDRQRELILKGLNAKEVLVHKSNISFDKKVNLIEEIDELINYIDESVPR